MGSFSYSNFYETSKTGPPFVDYHFAPISSKICSKITQVNLTIQIEIIPDAKFIPGRNRDHHRL